MAHDVNTRPDRRDPFILEEIDDPFMEVYFSGVPTPETSADIDGQAVLPGSNSVLLMGIMSIPFGIFLPPLGLLAGGIALWRAQGSRNSQRILPDQYSQHSVKNMKMGRRCATAGLVIGGIMAVMLAMGLADLT